MVLEAQASGLPVIVTDSGGPQENVIHGKTGFVIPADDEKALIEAISYIVSDYSSIKEMGQQAR